MKSIYIAGPYTSNPEENVKIAIHEGDYCARLGWYPYIPHFSHYWHMEIPHEYEFWMRQDEYWLRKCAAFLRIKGESAGADAEMAIAKEMGLPIYYSVFEVPKLRIILPILAI